MDDTSLDELWPTLCCLIRFSDLCVLRPKSRDQELEPEDESDAEEEEESDAEEEEDERLELVAEMAEGAAAGGGTAARPRPRPRAREDAPLGAALPLALLAATPAVPRELCDAGAASSAPGAPAASWAEELAPPSWNTPRLALFRKGPSPAGPPAPSRMSSGITSEDGPSSMRMPSTVAASGHKSTEVANTCFHCLSTALEKERLHADRRTSDRTEVRTTVGHDPPIANRNGCLDESIVKSRASETNSSVGSRQTQSTAESRLHRSQSVLMWIASIADQRLIARTDLSKLTANAWTHQNLQRTSASSRWRSKGPRMGWIFLHRVLVFLAWKGQPPSNAP